MYTNTECPDTHITHISTIYIHIHQTHTHTTYHISTHVTHILTTQTTLYTPLTTLTYIPIIPPSHTPLTLRILKSTNFTSPAQAHVMYHGPLTFFVTHSY